MFKKNVKCIPTKCKPTFGPPCMCLGLFSVVLVSMPPLLARGVSRSVFMNSGPQSHSHRENAAWVDPVPCPSTYHTR